MSRQYENVYVNPSNDRCIVLCSCGEPQHGSVAVAISDGGLDSVPWYFRWTAYVTINMNPSPTLWGRIKQAWGILRGRSWEGDFEMSAYEARLFSEWLHQHAMAALSPDGSIPQEPGDAKEVAKPRVFPLN